MVRLSLASARSTEHGWVLEEALASLGVPVAGDAGVVVTDDPRVGGDVVIPERLLGETFELLSLRGERSRGGYDRYGRLPGASLGERVLASPFSDLTALLADRLAARGVALAGASEPVVVLSHDVDRIDAREPIALAGRALDLAKSALSRDVASAAACLESLVAATVGMNTYDNFDDVMALEERYGFRSTFFFLLGRRGRLGARYALDDVRAVAAELHRRGFEVGVHVNPLDGDAPDVQRARRCELEDASG